MLRGIVRGLDLNLSQSVSRCFALQSIANRVIRTIVTAIHDKILIPRLTAAVIVAVKRSETAFLNIIRSGAFYYSTRDRSGRQEFDPTTPENFHRIHRIRRLRAFIPLSFSLPLFSLVSFLFFSWGYEYVPVDADRIGRIMLLRRQNEVSRSSPSTGPLVFYVKTEQFYSTSSSTLFFSLHMFSLSPYLCFSSRFSSSGISPTVGAINFIRATPLVLLHCYSPIYSDILELNLVPATHFEALPRLLWLTHLIRISRIPISRPQCASIDTFGNYIFVCVT